MRIGYGECGDLPMKLRTTTNQKFCGASKLATLRVNRELQQRENGVFWVLYS